MASFITENLKTNYLKDIAKSFNRSSEETLGKYYSDLIEIYCRIYHNVELLLQNELTGNQIDT